MTNDMGWWMWRYEPFDGHVVIHVDLAIWSLYGSICFRNPRWASVGVGPITIELATQS